MLKELVLHVSVLPLVGVNAPNIIIMKKDRFPSLDSITISCQVFVYSVYALHLFTYAFARAMFILKANTNIL